MGKSSRETYLLSVIKFVTYPNDNLVIEQCRCFSGTTGRESLMISIPLALNRSGLFCELSHPNRLTLGSLAACEHLRVMNGHMRLETLKELGIISATSIQHPRLPYTPATNANLRHSGRTVQLRCCMYADQLNHGPYTTFVCPAGYMTPHNGPLKFILSWRHFRPERNKIQ